MKTRLLRRHPVSQGNPKPAATRISLRGILRHVVMGKTPAGFSEGLLPVAIGRMDALLVMPEKRYSGQHLDVFKYRVENVGQTEIELAESIVLP
jgi:hypothetical protein